MVDKAIAPLAVGRTRHGGSGVVRFGEYAFGGTAMRVFSEGGEPLYTATVCMEGHELPDTEVWIKDWSENEGVAQAFVDAGIITLTGRRVPAGFVEALHARLTERAIAAMRRTP